MTTALYATLLSVSKSSDCVLRVLLLIRVAGLAWHPVFNFRMQHLGLDPTEQMHAKLLLAEIENAALKVQLESEMKGLKDVWEQPIGTRQRARKSGADAVQV